jgi:hypothetical protein
MKTLIASEAKQSRSHKQGLDCFVASLLAMTKNAETDDAHDRRR